MLLQITLIFFFYFKIIDKLTILTFFVIYVVIVFIKLLSFSKNIKIFFENLNLFERKKIKI